METQPGHVNWSPVNNELNKGEVREMAWHAVAHGADAVLYWQWRPAAGGQEQYHGALLDQSGQPRPLYQEIQQLGQDFKTASDLLVGSVIKAEVALLNSYDSRWSIHWQRHHREFSYEAHFNNYYSPLAKRNLDVDVISADEPLDGYALVIAPALLVLNDRRVEQIKEFVKRGGTLVLTLRTGMKNSYNALLPTRPPGPLAELAGIEVEDYYALQDPIPVKGQLFAGTSSLWAERLKIIDPERTLPLAHYGSANGWLDGQPAITVHPYGSGMVYFIGACLDDASQDILMDHILSSAGIRTFKTPVNIEVHKRTGGMGKEFFIIINHGSSEQAVELPWPAYEHLAHREVERVITLPPYGIAILTEQIKSNSGSQA